MEINGTEKNSGKAPSLKKIFSSNVYYEILYMLRLWLSDPAFLIDEGKYERFPLDIAREIVSLYVIDECRAFSLRGFMMLGLYGNLPSLTRFLKDKANLDSKQLWEEDIYPGDYNNINVENFCKLSRVNLKVARKLFPDSNFEVVCVGAYHQIRREDLVRERVIFLMENKKYICSIVKHVKKSTYHYESVVEPIEEFYQELTYKLGDHLVESCYTNDYGANLHYFEKYVKCGIIKPTPGLLERIYPSRKDYFEFVKVIVDKVVETEENPDLYYIRSALKTNKTDVIDYVTEKIKVTPQAYRNFRNLHGYDIDVFQYIFDNCDVNEIFNEKDIMYFYGRISFSRFFGSLIKPKRILAPVSLLVEMINSNSSHNFMRIFQTQKEHLNRTEIFRAIFDQLIDHKQCMYRIWVTGSDDSDNVKLFEIMAEYCSRNELDKLIIKFKTSASDIEDIDRVLHILYAKRRKLTHWLPIDIPPPPSKEYLANFPSIREAAKIVARKSRK